MGGPAHANRGRLRRAAGGLLAPSSAGSGRGTPMLDMGLFRNMRFTAAIGSVTIAFFTLFGFIFLMTQYFQFIQGFSPLSTGVRLLPVAASVAVAR